MLLRKRTWCSVKDRKGEITTTRLEPRGLSSRASAVIGRHWKIKDFPATIRQIHKHIPAFKKFSPSIFLFRKKAFKFELLLQCCKSSLPTSFCKFGHVERGMMYRHAHARIGPIVRRVLETRQSETLTYILATLLDVGTSFCTLIRRRTISTVSTTRISTVSTTRGSAATQATD